jgi:hypothetical protein
MNDLMTDSDNVLLLRPLAPEQGVTILPAVDPVTEATGAEGIVVAQIFAVKANSVEAFAKAAEATFAGYRAAGAREAGVLVTLDVANNFPQLPVRTDGPYLVWLGILKDNHMLETEFTPLVEQSLQSLPETGFLRGTLELVVLDPTHRSRLRWFPDHGKGPETGSRKCSRIRNDKTASGSNRTLSVSDLAIAHSLKNGS